MRVYQYAISFLIVATCFFILGSAIGYDKGVDMGIYLNSNIVSPAPLAVAEELIKCEATLKSHEGVINLCLDYLNNVSMKNALLNYELELLRNE